MPRVGLEPTRITPADFKSAASANSATPAKKLKATTGFEPVNRDFADPRLSSWLRRPIIMLPWLIFNGAEDEIRTRDLFLGKETFYH